MQVINKKYKRSTLRVLKLDRAYHDLIDKNDREMDSIDPDTPAYYRANNRHEVSQWKAYDKAINALNEMPLREQINFNKQYKAQFGYDCVGF
jgi:uncharacterized protein YjiS (DUF1127 family)